MPGEGDSPEVGPDRPSSDSEEIEARLNEDNGLIVLAGRELLDARTDAQAALSPDADPNVLNRLSQAADKMGQLHTDKLWFLGMLDAGLSPTQIKNVWDKRIEHGYRFKEEEEAASEE